MAYTIPDAGEATSSIQEILYQEQIDILVAGIGGDCVLSGLACTAQGSPNMTVAVAKGAVLSNGTMFAVAAANATITTADAQPRLDLIVITNAGAIAVRAGTAAAAPKPGTRSANDVALALVYVPAADTTISSDQIIDMRIVKSVGPITIDKVVAATTFNTSTAANTFYSKVIPNGLVLSGRGLRLSLGGSMLLNSGTPTITPLISLGGTTIWTDASAAATASATRRPWKFIATIFARSNTDIQMTDSVLWVGNAGAATTGLGDLAAGGAMLASVPAKGNITLDMDAADRTLLVSWAMSVSNVANEITLDSALLELM